MTRKNWLNLLFWVAVIAISLYIRHLGYRLDTTNRFHWLWYKVK